MRKKTHNPTELLRRHKLLDELMRSTPDVIYIKDKKGRFVMVNEAHARGVGAKPKDLVGKSDFDIHPREKAERMASDDLRVMSSGKPIVDKIERATRADGVDNFVSTTKIPRYDNRGRIIGIIGITRDITHRKQLERLKEEKAHIEKKLEAIEELNRTKSEFVSIVSHELRTPLAIIKEAANLITIGATGKIDKKKKKLLNMVTKNAQRLNGIIEDLLDISRIENGSLGLQYSLGDLISLLKEQANFFSKQARAKEIELKYALPQGRVNVFADLERINQVVTNLITNAIKFTEEGGKIRVELKVSRDKVKVGVIDSGVGISRENLHRLFDKFVQVSKDEQAIRRGVGLGLSIAKELVERHGGQIWVESKPGVGSRFYFTLPRFSTKHIEDQRSIDRINSILADRTLTYFVSLLIVDHRKFRKSLSIPAASFSKGLRGVIEKSLDENYRRAARKPEIVLEERRSGEYGIIVPDATDEKLKALSGSLKDNLAVFLKESGLKDAFVKAGISSQPSKNIPRKPKKLLANLSATKIFIGVNTRRFERVPYDTRIEVTDPERKREEFRTVDISEGGVCFTSRNYFNPNARIGLKIELTKPEKHIYTRARVAWVKNVSDPRQAGGAKYKVGLEFTSLKDNDREDLSKFVKLASA